MRELTIRGTVRRVESGEWTDKAGVKHPKGSVVLAGDFDKFELDLGQNPSAQGVVRLAALSARQGQVVELLVGVLSGDSFRSDPRFVFLDDLTPSGVKG